MKKKPGKKAKEITIDLPEVKDIPGQEHIRPPHMREMMDRFRVLEQQTKKTEGK